MPYFNIVIDVSITGNIKQQALEMLYKLRISKQDFQFLYHFKEGIVVSKTMFKTGNEYSVMLVHILLAVL